MIDFKVGSRNRVYPHVCGGTAANPSEYVDEKGLSPRVWGNL